MTTEPRININDVVSVRDLPAKPAGVADWLIGVPSNQGGPPFRAPFEQLPVQPAVQQQIDVLTAGQQTSAIYADQLEDLEAVVGTYTGQGAFVLNGPGAGQYAWTGSNWQFLRGDMLATKADKSAVAEVAGTATATVKGDLVEVHQDADGNVAFALHADGTHEFLKTKVGGVTITRDGDAAAEIDGRATWYGRYEQWAADLPGQFADALEIDIDEMGRVGRVLWADGSVTYPRSGGVELLEMISLPDGALAQNPNGGFTCTGLDKITTGQWKGCWVVGNHGLPAPGTGNTPSIVILSPDMRRIVKEIPCLPLFPTIVSIQGVAWDTSDDTIWFVDKANQTLRHISVAGADLGEHIAVPHAINGLAYRPDVDGLYAPAEGTANLNLYSCADGSLISTVSGISPTADQCHYNAALGQFWITRGNNGADGEYIAYDPDTGRMLLRRTLPGSQSIEGLHFDGSILTVVNDGAYHTEANPPLALACKYRIN
ncbi:hypothetical protein EIM50_13720 [Pseudoxanthomonas sp. SGD-10]|nr:hypothetical protein EIM50_13720 [Pseudoxanthomonas sp. SGD-10]